MSSHSPSSPSRWTLLARPSAMVAGASFLCWRDGFAHWPRVVLAATLILLLLALFWPTGYRPFDRLLKFLLQATVTIFSWAVLFILFALIFVPGRWILRSRLRAFSRHGKADTYWLEGPSASEIRDFQRQF